MTADLSFIDRFQAVVRMYPDHVAILTDGFKSVRYDALHAMSTYVAKQLQACGIGKGDLVALAIEKSTDYVAAQLGCWMTGAAFLPLDPGLPPDRREFIIKDSNAALIITRARHAGFFTTKNIFIIDDIPRDEVNLSPEKNDAADVAYVIYTSGSTGKPKGVIVPHRGICSMVLQQITAFGLHGKSRSLFYLSTSFDASLSDIWTALLAGATLCIETLNAVDLAAQLSDIIAARGITYMDVPPSLLRLLDAGKMPQHLETITIGGEACPPDIVRQWAQKIKIVNVYGPTEATVCTSFTPCDPATWSEPHIGRPMAGVTYRIVDDNLDDVAAGGSGELLIGGIQLADGYLNRPDLTARKFIQLNGARFYRTGDLVRNDASGSPVFIGRIDRQVKIRGQLVELEEVEAALLQDPQIVRAAAIKHVDGSLIAFVALKDGGAFYALPAALSDMLPVWMLPRHVIALPALPETASGKTDYQSLAHYDLACVKSAGGRPLDNFETRIAALWRRVLKTEHIAATDDFFVLGGDSFALLQLTMTAETEGLPLPPAVVVVQRTLENIARWMAAEHPLSAGMTDEMDADDLRRRMTPDAAWKNIFEAAKRLPAAPKKPATFFMTGATGFLGSWLLTDIMAKMPDAIFYLLIRAGDEKTAMDRLAAACARQKLTLTPGMRRRIVTVPGDFSKPFFGLEPVTWQALANKIDNVIHCGATINMVLPYDALAAANVDGVREVVKFCLSEKRKPLHYASTLSVFVSTDQNHGTLTESDHLEKTTRIYGGYAQSKWAAEYFLHQIPGNLIDVSIHRLGLVTGDTRTGTGSCKDFIDMFMRGIAAIGAVPQGAAGHIAVDATPVDYCAAAMAHIIAQGGAGIYHIANSRGFTLEMIIKALRESDLRLDSLPHDAWHEKMSARPLTAEESAACLGLGRLLPDGGTLQRHRAIDLFQATDVIFDTRRTDAALAGSGIICPPADAALLSLYLRNAMPSLKEKTA